MRNVARLWFSRLGMMLAAGLLIVGLAWLPAGVVPVEGSGLPAEALWGVRTETMQRFILKPPPVPAERPRAYWSFSRYRSAVLTYLRQLVSGQVTDTAREWRNGRIVEVTRPVLPVVQERALVSLRLLTQVLGLGMAAGAVLGLLSLRHGALRGLPWALPWPGWRCPTSWRWSCCRC